MTNLKQNLLVLSAIGIFGILVYGAFFTPKVESPAPQFNATPNVSFDYGYHTGVTHTTTTVGTTAVQVLADGLAGLNSVVENMSSTVVFCYEKATTTGAVANGGIALVQYGVMGGDRSSPYYGGYACVTGSGTTTVSVMYK